MIKLFCTVCLFYFYGSALAQERSFYGGFFPEGSITYSFTKKYQSTFKVESQHIQFDDRNGEQMEWKYAHYRTDLQGFVASKLSPFWKVSLGYQYRIEGDGPEHNRAIQQVAYVHNSPRVRFSHRLRFDQTFSKGEKENEYRARYRFAAEIPLSGQTLDPGEYYLITSNEVIVGTSGGNEEIENRLVGSLGHYFGKQAKLEAGLDWRIDKIIANGLRNRLWLKVGCYFNF